MTLIDFLTPILPSRGRRFAVSLACCAALVVGGTRPGAAAAWRAAPVSTEPEEESRPKSGPQTEETVAAARSREERRVDLGRPADVRLTRAPAAVCARIAVWRSHHDAKQSEHDLRNGVGAPLLC